MDFDLAVFIFGCIGAAAPEVVRIYRTKSHHMDISLKNALVSVTFFLLGGAIAVALQSSSPYAAFYSGVATPIIVSKLGEQSPTLPSKELYPATPPTGSITSPAKHPSRMDDKHGIENPPYKLIRRESEFARHLSIREYLWMLNASR